MARFDLKPKSMSNVLVFEDAPAGVRAGISAGCQVVWVPAKDQKDGSDQAKWLLEERVTVRRDGVPLSFIPFVFH